MAIGEGVAEDPGGERIATHEARRHEAIGHGEAAGDAIGRGVDAGDPRLERLAVVGVRPEVVPGVGVDCVGVRRAGQAEQQCEER